MRFPSELRVTLCSLLVFIAVGQASEASDRNAIESAVASLNNQSARAALFTKDAEGRLMLEGLLAPRAASGSPGLDSIFGNAGSSQATIVRIPGFELVISPEPMGEALLVPASFAGVPDIPVGPRHIVSRKIRFVTSGVALVDAVIEAQGPISFRFPMGDQAAGTEANIEGATTGVVLVMVRDHGHWRVAVARRVTP